MRRFFLYYIPTIFLSVLFIACHSQTQPAKAGASPDAAGKVSIGALVHEDINNGNTRDIIHRLDSFYNIQSRVGFNGSVLVGSKGKILYERYCGLANRETGMPLSSESASQLASTSKTFTGAAVLYLHQHKYLDIDQPVQTYLKQFPYPAITIKMLLCHRSGLPDYTKWVPRYRKDTRSPISNAALMSMFAQYRPALEFRPNTRFKYSNSNYAVLANIIEEVTELNYRDFMRKYVFGPLGMNNTFVYDPYKPVPSKTALSYKYNWVREQDMFADGIYGDKGIYSTVEDMYRWDQSFYKNVLLSNETLEMAYGPCSFEKPGQKNYGLGWRMLCFPDGGKVIYHNGWWHGNNTVFYRFIKENLTIIILGNKYNSNIYRQTKVVYALVKGTSVAEGFDTEE